MKYLIKQKKEKRKMCLRSHLCLGSNLPSNANARKRTIEKKKTRNQYLIIRRIYFEFSQKIFLKEIDKATRRKVYKRLRSANESEIRHFFLKEFYYDKDNDIQIVL